MKSEVSSSTAGMLIWVTAVNDLETKCFGFKNLGKFPYVGLLGS